MLDLTYLCQDYHTFVVGAVGPYISKKSKMLMLGLGGGSLGSYIVSKFPQVCSHFNFTIKIFILFPLLFM